MMMMQVISSTLAAASQRNRPCGPSSGLRFAIPIRMQTKTMARNTSGCANLDVDWKETEVAHVFTADLPGLKKEQVKIEVEEGGVMKISGERSRGVGEENVKYIRSERSSGEFQRRFRLPENVDTDAIEAKMEDGVLTITVPKKKPEEPVVKNVEISG